MSGQPENPLQQPAPGTMYGDQQPKQGGSKVWLWVLGIIGVVFLLGAAICCGGVYFAYRTGTGMMAEVYKNQLQKNPVIQEHIGDIESMNFDLTATSEHAEDSNGAVAFDIQGSKGSGVLLLRQNPGTNEITSAELVMADGTRYDISVENLEPSTGGVDIDLGEPVTAQPGTPEAAVPAPTATPAETEQPAGNTTP